MHRPRLVNAIVTLPFFFLAGCFMAWASYKEIASFFEAKNSMLGQTPSYIMLVRGLAGFVLTIFIATYGFIYIIVRGHGLIWYRLDYGDMIVDKSGQVTHRVQQEVEWVPRYGPELRGKKIRRQERF